MLDLEPKENEAPREKRESHPLAAVLIRRLLIPVGLALALLLPIKSQHNGSSIESAPTSTPVADNLLILIPSCSTDKEALLTVRSQGVSATEFGVSQRIKDVKTGAEYIIRHVTPPHDLPEEFTLREGEEYRNEQGLRAFVLSQGQLVEGKLVEESLNPPFVQPRLIRSDTKSIPYC